MDWLLVLVVVVVVGAVAAAIVVVRRRDRPSEVGETEASLREARRAAEANRDAPEVRDWDHGGPH